MSSAVALRHVAFEEAGLIAPALAERGIDLAYVEAPLAGETAIAALDPDLLIVLGGPIGVYEEAAYPFLSAEIALLRRRLAAGRPTLGVCLGAQLMARALGAAVRPGGRKEIGYAPLTLTAAGEAGPLAALAAADGTVLHWHGDVMDLPAGCERLARTPACPVQAFARGPGVLALQFHVEVEPPALEAWLVGHAAEIAATPGVEPALLRDQARTLGARVAAAGRRLIDAWLDGAG
ncbi:MAG: glutamine amidotransferase, partial [Caulobacterales bacterium]|nr:glutamine amidotransferase [Caulobacterales bacterium]